MANSKARVEIVLGILVLGIVGFLLYVYTQQTKIHPAIKAKAAMRQAYQIHQSLFAYAQTHDGNFPVTPNDGSGPHTANDAFRELFRAGLVDDEKLFFVQGSAWHAGKTRPDGDIGTEATGFRETLTKNENHFAYVTGLNANSSPAATPLVMDGFMPGSDLRWSNDRQEKGGIWKGDYVIVIRVGGAAKVHEPDSEGHVMEPIDGKLQNISKLIEKVPGAMVLNPDG